MFSTKKREIGVYGISFLILFGSWLFLMSNLGRWELFADAWFMSVTMMFGSFIAGASSEGGGAVAFPVMTLFFKISPAVARDFSLMIQSVGMTCASIAILYTRIKVLKNVIIYASAGAFFGIPIGIMLSAHLSPPVVKMFFVSLWMAFAIVLFFVNSNEHSFLCQKLNLSKEKQICVLIGLGFCGGIITGLLGNGLDILVFSYITLRYRVSEKIGTPTSVILMAIGSIIGIFWLNFPVNRIHYEAFEYWLVCVPIVMIGAPLGASFISNKSQSFIKKLLILSIAIQFICALFIVKHTILSINVGIFTLLIGILLFKKMKQGGNYLEKKI